MLVGLDRQWNLRRQVSGNSTYYMYQALCPLLIIRFLLFLISTLGGFFILQMDIECIRDT